MDVLVKAQNGEQLARVAYFPGIQAKDAKEAMQEMGFKGYLASNTGGVLAPSMRLSPGAEIIFIQKLARDSSWFSLHGRLPTASAFAMSVSQMKKHLGNSENTVYDVGRVSASMALPLANKSFAVFVRHLESHELDDCDWKFVIGMMDMSDYYDNQENRQRHLFDSLEIYLASRLPGHNIRITQRDDTVVEIEIGDQWIPLCYVGVKPELGINGEPCVEALKYVTKQRREYHWSYWLSCIPMLILEVVGATIRVGGAICHERPGYQPFTPYLHILRYLEDNGHLMHLSRALSSIPVAIKFLADFYRVLRPSVQRVYEARADATAWPWYLTDEVEKHPGLRVERFTRELDNSTVRKMYRGRDPQLIFRLRYSNGDEKIFKFCQRYGIDVHSKWSEAGFAPRFSYETLPGEWNVIKMDYYSSREGWWPVHVLDPTSYSGEALEHDAWTLCREHIVAAYEEVHRQYPSHVHGDMRKRNILYNIKTAQVAFIDFDWAGESGQVRYPLFLNQMINWPQGVDSAKIMLASHDLELLRADLRLSHLSRD